MFRVIWQFVSTWETHMFYSQIQNISQGATGRSFLRYPGISTSSPPGKRWGAGKRWGNKKFRGVQAADSWTGRQKNQENQKKSNAQIQLVWNSFSQKKIGGKTPKPPKRYHFWPLPPPKNIRSGWLQLYSSWPWGRGGAFHRWEIMWMHTQRAVVQPAVKKKLGVKNIPTWRIRTFVE